MAPDHGRDDRSGRYLVAYDIPDDTTRARVARLLKGYGVRVQYSVFECCLSERERRQLVAMLPRLLDAGLDQVQLFEISESAGPGAFADLPSAYWLA